MIPFRSKIRENQIAEFDLNISLNGTRIDQVKSYTFLGQNVDDRWTWYNHANKVKKCITPFVFVLKRTRHFLTDKTAEMLYFAYIYHMFQRLGTRSVIRLYRNFVFSSTRPQRVSTSFLI